MEKEAVSTEDVYDGMSRYEATIVYADVLVCKMFGLSFSRELDLRAYLLHSWYACLRCHLLLIRTDRLRTDFLR